MNITYNDSELQEAINKLLKAGLDEAVKEGLQEACFVIEAAAKEKCPVDDGQLRQSITTEVTDDLKGYVGSVLEYAPYVHQGTGIFAAEGNGRKTAWSYLDAKGEWHTTTGQKANPFLQEAIEDNRKNILEAFKNRL